MSWPGVLLTLLIAAAIGAGVFIEKRQSGRASGGLQDRLEFLEQRVRLLEEENLRLLGLVDRLERAGAVDDPEAVIRSDLEAIAGDIRGLQWKNRVRYKIVTRDGIGDLIRAKVRGRPADAETNRRRLVAWTALGLTDDDADWHKLMGRLYPGTTTAFFEEETGVLHVARGTPLEEANERVLLVHELIRALLDQHHDLGSFFAPVIDELWRDSDQALARRALAAGDAGITTLHYNSQFGSPLVTADAELREFGALATLLGPGDGDEGEAAARAMAAFPHAEGRSFCASLFNNMSFLEVDGAYGRPPQSTAEILHPEIYAAGDFRPRRFDWREEDFRVTGREILWSDVAGELGSRLVLGRHLPGERAEGAAEGWRGDRFIVYGPANAKTKGASVLWRSEWADGDEARKFKEALGEALGIRYALKTPVTGRYDGERFLLLELTDDAKGVVFVDAESKALREEIRGRLP